MLILVIIWIIYWEVSKEIKPKPYLPLTKRLRRMLAKRTPVLCARHLSSQRGRMSIVDAKNCVKCRRDRR